MPRGQDVPDLQRYWQPKIHTVYQDQSRTGITQMHNQQSSFTSERRDKLKKVPYNFYYLRFALTQCNFGVSPDYAGLQNHDPFSHLAS